jgi:hypothetical protein
MRVAMIPRMAADIGLNLPCVSGHQSELDASEAEMLRFNNITTRAFMIASEHRYS